MLSTGDSRRTRARCSLLTRIERALASYVRGQVLLSLIIGDERGPRHVAARHARLGARAPTRTPLLFGAWVAITELIPYLGPWLGAIPPVIYALVVASDLGDLGRDCSSSGIHQIEGHVVVPERDGQRAPAAPAARHLRPARGRGDLRARPAILVALPLLAAGRAIWEFFAERVSLEPWEEGGTVPVEVEIEDTRPVSPVPPADPPAAASR